MLNLFFDMDGCITESKQKISPKMKEKLSKFDNIVVISGASKEQMEIQLDGLPCTMLAQSGNETPLWKNKLTKGEEQEVYFYVHDFGDPYLHEKYEDRGCQVSYSMLGHHAPQELKNNYDPKQLIRQAVLKQHPFKSKTLAVRIAGTTCLDFTLKKGTKGDNLKRWLKAKKLKKQNCVYFGDALFKGGNDESVKGVMKCVAVSSPQDLLNKLEKYV